VSGYPDPATPVLDVDLFGSSPDLRSIAVIREWEPPEGYWVAFSGGKDSIVLLDLVRRSGVAHETHHNLTTIDPPELVLFIRRQYPDVTIDKPEKSFWQHIRDGYGLPLRQARWCCKELKERGGVGRRVLTGVRTAESAARKARMGSNLVHVCQRSGAQKTMVNPIAAWSDEDVWTYIRRRGLPYCSLYDEGWQRLGCVLCPFERDMARAQARWPKLFAGLERAVRDVYPRQKSFQKFGSPEAVLEWWLARDGAVPGGEDEQFAFDQFGEEVRDDNR
jgi:phosphoadenosine phosphosulfate reductase